MGYDEQSFLNGVIVGMSQKGYAAYTKYADGDLLPPPEATPPPGKYYVFMPTVTLSTEVEGGVIRYTDDNTSPILYGKNYESGKSWIVDSKQTIAAWVLTESSWSRIANFTYEFENPLATLSDDVQWSRSTVSMSDSVQVVFGFGDNVEDNIGIEGRLTIYDETEQSTV